MAIIKVKFESKGDRLKSSWLNNQTSQKQLKHIQTQSLWCKKGFCAITGSQPILPVHTYINEVNEDQYRDLNHADLYCRVGPNLDSKNIDRDQLSTHNKSFIIENYCIVKNTKQLLYYWKDFCIKQVDLIILLSIVRNNQPEVDIILQRKLHSIDNLW